MQTLKVKDYNYSYGLIIACCSFPLTFMAIAAFLNNNYLIALLITLSVYTVAFVYFVRHLRKTEDEYLIVADQQSVTFLNHGTYKWTELSNISGYTKVVGYGFGKGSGRYEAKYIQISFVKGSSFTIEVTNCDYEYQE